MLLCLIAIAIAEYAIIFK